MAHYLTNNEKFHIFSKSPVLSSMAVSQAVNKSGHTVSTNDVWADDVPWFTEVADEAGAITRAADARYNDLILWGSDIYVRKGDKTNGASTGTTFAELWEKHTDLTEARAYALSSVTTQTPTNIVTKTVEIKNASDKIVLKYHVGKQIDLLTTANNANVASTWAARMFIDGKVVDQFVSPTDKVFAGNPSTGYTTLVYTATATGNKYGFVAEGEGDDDFVNNAFAGIVQFNKSRTSTHKFAASVFEYVGNKLATSLSNITTSISDEISAATLPNGDDAIKSATGDAVTKLVTAEQVKEYVDENAKVTLTADTADGSTGITISPNGEESTSFTIGIDQETIATKASVDDLSDIVSGVSQTVASIQTDLTSGSIASAIQDAQDTADEALGLAETAVQSVTVNGTKSSGTSVSITALTAVDSSNAGNNGITIGETTDKKVTLSVIPATYTPATEGVVGSWDNNTNIAKASDVEAAISDAVKSITIPDVTTTSDAQAVGVTASGHVVSVDTADYTKAKYDENGKVTTQGIWEMNHRNYLVTGDVVRNFVVDETTKTLDAAKTYSDSLHSTNLVYIVLGDNETLPDASADTVGKIYLVKEGNTVDDETEIDAISGSYVEYMTRKVSETEYTWEKIGTTAADLIGYAKTITINGESKPVSNNTVNLGKVAASVTAGGGITNGTITDGGALSLTLDKASTAGKGIVQLASTHEDSDTEKAATGATVAAAISGISSTSQSDNGVTITTAGGSVTGVEVTTTSLVSNDALVDSVTDNNLITAADALAAIKLAKPDNYVAFVTGYTDKGAKVTTTQGAEIKVLDGRGTSVTDKDLWGTKATLDASDNLTITHGWVTNPNASDEKAWNSSITKVEDNKAYIGEELYANIQTERIKDGSSMFYESTLASFSSDLSSLTNGNKMFCDSSLTSFSSDLSSLTNGNKMFTNCTNLESFNSNLSSLTNGYYMFAYSQNLSEFNSNLSNLTDGSSMFTNCSNLEAFSLNLSSMTNGNAMFSGCHNLESFHSDLSNLTNGYNMFSWCNALKSFNSDLSSLTDGSGMFDKCDALGSFNTDLSNLTDGYGMFSNCKKLESFCGDLSSLTDGTHMFYDSSLASFSSDLSSLTNGIAMFSGCKLDTESVEIIADTINDVTELEVSYNGVTKRIDIKIGNETPNDAEDAAFKQMQDKGWDVYVNGSDTEYVLRTGEASLDETGETIATPKPYWAKPIEVTEDKAEYVGQDGKFYQVIGGQFIYVNDPETYGMFVSLEDAVANMRLTKYVKPEVEA